MKKQERNNYIKEQVEKGVSYQDIANELGISRQRVHQLASGYTTIGMKATARKLLAGSTCLTCGSSAKIHIHHLNGNSSDNDINNLVTLCEEHHVQAHTGSTRRRARRAPEWPITIPVHPKIEFKPKIVKVRIIA